MSDRHYLNGDPYYCATCGLGFGEFMACEEIDCRLETKSDAQLRLDLHNATLHLRDRGWTVERQKNGWLVYTGQSTKEFFDAAEQLLCLAKINQWEPSR